MTVRAASYPSAGRAAYALGVLILLGFVLTTDITLTALLIEPMKRELGLTDVEVALLQGTAYGLALGITSVPMGRLIDRVSRRLLLAFGLVGWTGALVAIGLAHGMVQLVAARIVLGAVAALIVPAAFSLASDLYPAERRSLATSMLVTGQALGQGFGMLAGGLLFDTLSRSHGLPLAPWRLIYLGAAGLGAVFLLLLAPLREPVRQERARASTRLREALRELRAHAPFFVPLLIGLLFAQVTIQAATVWSSPLLIRRGLTPGMFAGWMGAVLLAGGIGGALAGGWLAERGRRRAGRPGVLLPATAFALAIVPASLYAVAPGLPLFAILFAVNILAGAAVATIGVVAITLVIPNDIRGLALGVNTLGAALFGAAGAPALVAVLSRALGGEDRLGVALTMICAPCAIGSALGFALAIRAAAADGPRPRTPRTLATGPAGQPRTGAVH